MIAGTGSQGLTRNVRAICAERAWSDDTRTTEWSIEVAFASEDVANAFRERWRERLSGGFDG